MSLLNSSPVTLGHAPHADFSLSLVSPWGLICWVSGLNLLSCFAAAHISAVGITTACLVLDLRAPFHPPPPGSVVVAFP